MNYDLISIVNKTLDKLYDNEKFLFENDSSERNLVFHFSRYFINEIEGTELVKYDVDCEYNRNILSERKFKEIIYNYDGKKHKIYPDFILHKRGSNDYNKLAIEFKKHSNRREESKEKDLFKLKVLTDQSINSEFRYELGLFIVFGKEREDVKVIRVIDCNVIDE